MSPDFCHDRRVRRARFTILLLVLLAIPACGGDPVSPAPRLTTIVVSAPVGPLLAVGAAVQLTAEGRDAAGQPFGTQVEWSSSDPTVAVVSTAGLVTTRAPGTARIEARSGDVAGGVDFTVMDVDTEAIRGWLDDAFTAALVAGLTSSAGAVQAALAEADAAITAGDLLAIETALDKVPPLASAASDPDERAFLAVLVLITGQALRTLGL